MHEGREVIGSVQYLAIKKQPFWQGQEGHCMRNERL